jgi:hypothetical protein
MRHKCSLCHSRISHHIIHRNKCNFCFKTICSECFNDLPYCKSCNEKICYECQSKKDNDVCTNCFQNKSIKCRICRYDCMFPEKCIKCNKNTCSYCLCLKNKRCRKCNYSLCIGRKLILISYKKEITNFNLLPKDIIKYIISFL